MDNVALEENLYHDELAGTDSSGTSQSSQDSEKKSQIEHFEDNSNKEEYNNGGFGGRKGVHLSWSRITKSVVLKELITGMLRSSISAPPSNKDNVPKKDDKRASLSSMRFASSKRLMTKAILNEVSASAEPGRILALMGPSGSGKTSLLDVLAGRNPFDSGVIKIDGQEATGVMMKQLKRKIAYVKQQDIFFNHLTVRDQLTYTALLRLPSKWSKERKHAEVNNLITLLRLSKCADSPIMLISGGEKKRVNIGTELLTDPSVIMLDEPTSGLDSTSAVALLKMLKDLARQQGKTVITSIHQPSSAVFRSFDKLLMLADGHVVYFGNPVDSLQYLKRQEYECPGGYNAADHWMDLLVTDSAIDEDTLCNGGENMLLAKRKLIAAWDNETVADEIEKGGCENQPLLDAEDGTMELIERKYNATWMTQFWVLTHRSLKNSRSAVFTLMNVIKAVGVGIVTGLMWFQMKNTEKTVVDRSAYFFFTMSYWVFDAMFTALMTFPSEREIIFKERASGSYHLSAYFMAKTISEAPTRLSLPVFYMIISYWMAMINPRFVVFLGTTFCTMLSVLAGESLGLLIGASVMDFDRAMTVMVVISLALLLVGGFFVDNMPVFIQWVKYLSPFKYSFDASQQMVFDRDVPCDGSGVLELVCGGSSEGYATSQEVINFLNVQGSVGFNVGILLLIFLIPRYGAYWFLNRKKAGERGA